MPPILIVHGDKDTLVPLAQAQTFADGLKTAGINATLCVTAGRGHGDVMDDAAKAEVIAFFEKNLVQAVGGSKLAGAIPLSAL